MGLLVGTVAMLAFGTLVRPSQWILGLASLWVWPAGLSSSSRSLLGSLLRHLAPPTCQRPSSSLSTTCVSSWAWDGPSIQQVTSLARLTSRLVQPKRSTDLQHCRLRQQDRLRAGMLVLRKE